MGRNARHGAFPKDGRPARRTGSGRNGHAQIRLCTDARQTCDLRFPLSDHAIFRPA